MVSFGEDFNEDRVYANADSNDRFSFAIDIFLVVHRRRILIIELSPPNNTNGEHQRCPTNQFSYGSMLDLLAEQIHLPPLEV